MIDIHMEIQAVSSSSKILKLKTILYEVWQSATLMFILAVVYVEDVRAFVVCICKNQNTTDSPKKT